MHKKIITIIAFLCVAVFGLSGCSGCVEAYLSKNRLPVLENEYFQYSIATFKDGTREAYLTGFTELGAEQTHLIVPNKIDGVPIVSFGYSYSASLTKQEFVCNFESDKLERIYIPFKIIDYRQECKVFDNCPNCIPVLWGNPEEQGVIILNNAMYGNNLWEKYLSKFSLDGTAKYSLKLANVSYMYNYDDAECDGYYWIDGYNEEFIKFIPPEPTRNGYTFDGWYKEPECISIWNFETDKLKTSIVELSKCDNLDKYNPEQITFLYAKWIKN